MRLPNGRWIIRQAPLVIAVLAVLVLFWGLGDGSLERWDEAIYARVAREIVRSGDWLTLRWDNQSMWFEKPPLLIWAMAFLYRLFGVNEFWTRAPSALCGVGVVVATWALGSRIYDGIVGWFAAMILLTSSMFVWSARVGMMDVPLTLMTTLAIYGYVRLTQDRQEWWYLISLSCAGAIMVKSVGGLMAPAIIGIALILDGMILSACRSRHFWLAFVAALLVVAPWHIAMVAKYGWMFLDEYIGYHVLQRATVHLSFKSHTRYFAIESLYAGFYPWVLMAPFALALSIKELTEGRSQSRVLMLTVALVGGVYTLTVISLDLYFLPCYPALAVLTAVALVEALRSRTSVLFGGLTVASAAVAIDAPRGVIFAVGSGILVIGLLASLARKHIERFMGVGMCLFILVTAASTLRPLYDRPLYPAATLARMVESSSQSEPDPLVIFPDEVWLFNQVVAFYNDRPIQKASTIEDLVALTDSGGLLRILLPEEKLASLSACFTTDIHAKAKRLVYATIRRLESCQ